MEVSPRARLAWANRNLEAAADIIVADHLRAMSARVGVNPIDGFDLVDEAHLLDPEEVEL